MLKRVIKLLVVILAIASMAQSVEILVQIKGDWPVKDTIFREVYNDASELIAIDTIIGVDNGKGTVLTLKEDGAAWGKKASLPRFIVIRVPNVTIAQAQPYHVKQLKRAIYDSLLTLFQGGQLTIDPDTIITGIDTTIIDRFITIPKSKILNYLNDEGSE